MEHTPIKDLVINGTLYAKYTMDAGLLFLKVIKNIIPDNEGHSEDYFQGLISLIEERSFKGIAYFNVD